MSRSRANANSVRTQSRSTPRKSRIRLWMLWAPVLLLAAACGGSQAALSEEAAATLALADQNQPNLVLSDDLASTELLDGSSGLITTLGDVVTGDRAILVWYWAPN